MEENQPKPVNIQEIKPINPRKNYLKISLPLAGMVLLVGAAYLTINNAMQQQQDNRSKASVANNMVLNPGFESGTSPWQLQKRGSAAGSLTTTTSDKVEGAAAGQVNVTAASSQVYDAELAQYGKALTAGQTYTFTFKAKASGSKSIDAVVQNASSPYTDYLRKTITLNTSWQTYTYTFTAPQTVSSGMVAFQLARATGTYWVDDVAFYQGNGSGASVATDNGTSVSNLLSNPGCEGTTAQYKGYQGTLSLATGVKRSGNSSCKMVSTSSSYYDMETFQSSPNPQKGQTFSGAAWVRADSNTGKPVYLSLRESGGSTGNRSAYGAPVYLSTNWQLVQNTFTVQSTGRTSLDYYVVQESASSGQSFYIDDMVFVQGSSINLATPTPIQPTPTLVPTATKVPTQAPTAVPPTATSAPTSGATPTSGPTIMTINKSSYTPGENVTVYWTNISGATAKDWIGLYTPSAANGDEIGWIYTNCTQTSTTPVAAGNCTFPLPATAPAGTLELRLHSNDTNNVIAESPTFTLVGPTATPTTALMTATPFPTAIPTAVPTVIAQTPIPTATVVPGNTYVNVALLLHGLGKGGDSVNAGSTGNMSPLHPQKPVTVDVYDVQNQLVISKTGTVSFNATNGNFTGNVELGSQFATGIYTVKVKTEQNLRGLIGGIQTITQGQVTNLPSATLVTGDINNDNQINIVDYNIIVGCYSDLLPPVSCTDINKLRADLTDDGKVNQFDYNLFIRELTNLGGQ